MYLHEKRCTTLSTINSLSVVGKKQQKNYCHLRRNLGRELSYNTITPYNYKKKLEML